MASCCAGRACAEAQAQGSRGVSEARPPAATPAAKLLLCQSIPEFFGWEGGSFSLETFSAWLGVAGPCRVGTAGCTAGFQLWLGSGKLSGFWVEGVGLR